MPITFSRSLNLFILLTLFLLPEVSSLRQECCKALGVPEKCYQHMCNPTVIPKVINRYKVFDPGYNCQAHLLPISQCLTNGRDTTSCTAKNADDDEFSYCFPMCNATMSYETEMKSPLLSCFVMNVPALFPCFVASYTDAPTPPRDLVLSSKTKTSATFQWDKPEELSDIVRVYKLHLIERKNMKEIETKYETTELEFTFEDLSVKSSYSVYVVAHGAIHKNNEDWNKSLRSNIVQFVTDEEIVVTKEEFKYPPSAKYIEFPCHLKRITGAEAEIEWVKVTDGVGTLIENDERFSVVSYLAEKFSSDVLSSLKITDLQSSDFVTYRCYIKDTRVEYGEVVLTSFIHSEEAPNDNPPDTLLECCSKGVHNPGCKSICGGVEVDKSSEMRPGLYLPPAGCTKEIDKLFKCSQSVGDNAGCCIHKKVPFSCLGMCDSRFSMKEFKMRQCQSHMKTVYGCQLGLIDLKPEAVSFVKTKHSYGDTYTFSWEMPLDVKAFHVYSRKGHDKWLVRVTVDTAVDVTDADQVVLVSVNEYGFSQQHRLSFENDEWRTVDHW